MGTSHKKKDLLKVGFERDILSCHGVSSLEWHIGWTTLQETAQLFIPVDMLNLPLMQMHINNTIEEM